MADDLAPFFESRETRNGRLPSGVRTKFESASSAAELNGDAHFQDKQYVSLWLSQRVGLPRGQILSNFDSINQRFFGTGATAATAYDSISKDYAVPKAPDASEAVGVEKAEEDYNPGTGMPTAGKDGFLYNVTQSGRAAGAGFTGFAQKVPAGIYSQAASATGPSLVDPTASEEYQSLKRQNERLENPFQFSVVYDESSSFAPVLSEEDQAKVAANRARMSAILGAGDTQNRESVKAWSATNTGAVSKEYRDLAKFWYQLSEGAGERLGVDPEFQKTTLGQLATSAGSVPATAALAALGLPGLVGMEASFFADSESDRMATQGATYDPQKAFAGNLVSSLPQMALERAFGVERLLNNVLGEVPKFAGKVKFGDFAKNVVRAGLTSGAEEAITEPAQGFWNDYVASLTYDEQRETITGEGAKRRFVESVSAFALGSLFGGGVSAVSGADEARTARGVPEYLTAKDDLPLKAADFNALREAKSDAEITAIAPDESTGRILLAAANGDTEAQAAYNAQVVEKNFVKTDGVPVDGMQLQDVNGVPVVQMEDGASFALDLSQEEDRVFFEGMKAQAATVVQAQEQAETTEQMATVQEEAKEEAAPEAVKAEQETAAAEEKSFADTAIAKLESMKFQTTDGQLYSATPLTLAWDSALDTAILAIKGGKALADVVQTAIDHFREKYGQEDNEQETKIVEAITELMAQREQARTANISATKEDAAPTPLVPASRETIKEALTGVPQTAQQALRAQAERLRAKKLAASANFIRQLNAGNVAERSKAVRKSQEASILSFLGAPINTRLAKVSKPLGQVLRRFEYDTGMAIAKDFNAVQPFIVGLEQMEKADARTMDFALKNGDTETRDQLLSKYNLKKEFSAVEKVLRNTRKRAISVGYEVGEIEDYFPRKVKDLDGLYNLYYGRPEYGVIEKALDAAEKKARIAGVVFTLEDRQQVINTALQGMGRQGSAKPSNLKERKTEIVSAEADPFYAGSTEALINYVTRLNEAIEKRRFFGKSAVNEDGQASTGSQLSISKSVGAYVDQLLSKGEITREQQREVTAILEARFSSGVASDFIQNLKTLAYLSTMGQITSALSQVTDLAFSMYENGALRTLVAATKAVGNKSEITKESLGLDAIADEFRDTGRLQQILNNTFKAVGIHYLDRIGKETLMNAKFAKMRAEVLAGKMTPRTREVIQTSFNPEEQAQVMQDLAAGKKTEDSLFLVYSVLADYQPINRSEYPEGYLRSPKGRIFYMLKSFTLKQIDVFRREAFTKIVNGSAKQKVEGFRNLAHLSALLLLAGVPVDWLKDMIMGRDPKLPDLVVDNLLKLVAINRWALYQFRERPDPAAAALLLVSPPTPFFTYPARDILTAAKQVSKGEDIKPGEFESWRALPWVGSLYYWRGGGGAEKIRKRNEKEDKKTFQKPRNRRD